MNYRFRRYKRSQTLRESLAETDLSYKHLVYPLFITEGKGVKKEIQSMPGIYKMSPELASEYIDKLQNDGLRHYILFGIPKNKDEVGSSAYDEKGPVPSALRLLKEAYGRSIELYADVCLCEYTSHGHCGILDSDSSVNNDKSLDLYAKAGLVYAQAGADWLAPSNMLDLRVRSLRQALDENGYTDRSILSYSAKYSSSYYGPFRDAAESSPSFGDRKSYQIDIRNRRLALSEVLADGEQGADAVMVKPALAFLDIIQQARQMTNLPLYTYNVSGEYSMVKVAVKAGLFEEKSIVLENLTAMRRAGADMIITYHAEDLVKNQWLKD